MFFQICQQWIKLNHFTSFRCGSTYRLFGPPCKSSWSPLNKQNIPTLSNLPSLRPPTTPPWSQSSRLKIFTQCIIASTLKEMSTYTTFKWSKSYHAEISQRQLKLPNPTLLTDFVFLSFCPFVFLSFCQSPQGPNFVGGIFNPVHKHQPPKWSPIFWVEYSTLWLIIRWRHCTVFPHARENVPHPLCEGSRKFGN